MRFTITLLSFCLLPTLLLSQGTFCNSAGNIVLFTNYDGGNLTINVNQNISNLKIGVVSYEAVNITITGAYASNVTEVRYAGYNSNNTNCGSTISATSINGAGSAATSITFAPTSTLSNSYGYSSIICGYSCSTTSSQGGCNTVDQIEAYWSSVFSNSALYFHRVQYNCWSGTQNISAGGDCCALATSLAISSSTTDESCYAACDGTATASIGGGQPPYTFAWSTGDTSLSISDLCPGTYYAIAIDANSATAIDTVVIDSAGPILSSQSVQLCFGEELIVGTSTYSTSGVYTDTLEAAAGCDSVVVTDLTVDDEITFTQSFNESECAGLVVEVGNNSYSTSGTYVDTLTAANGCDSTVISILQINPADFITVQPSNQNKTEGTNAKFSVEVTDSTLGFQWQEDNGTGFVNLTNAGPYSGTDSDELKVSNVQLTMDGNVYRCLVADDDCSDTSEVAILSVSKAQGLFEVGSNTWKIYPNPTQELLFVESEDAAKASQAIIQDMQGRVILQQRLGAQTSPYSIDLHTLPAGQYVLVMKGETVERHLISIVR